MTLDEQMIRRAIRLAMNGRGSVEPNPMVGCVLVRDDRIIGEGWHTHFGGPHAEPTALADCIWRGESPAGATAYVTLEPCCHTNKKTPPCAPRLIEAKIARVFVGCLDPNPEVNGRGIVTLRDAGIDVVRADEKLESECKQLIAAFLKWNRARLPYVTMKWAETAEGKVAGAHGARLQISGPVASHQVHRLRARSDVIMIGSQTAITDNPMLTARDIPEPRTLLRYVLDRRRRVPLSAKLFQTARAVPVVVGFGPEHYSASDTSQLKALGVDVYPTPFLDRALIDLQTRKISGQLATHVLIEAGPTLANAFFTDGLVDRLWVLKSKCIFVNDANAPIAAQIPRTFIQVGEADLGDDKLIEFLNSNSEAFFAAVPSADFVLASQAPT